MVEPDFPTSEFEMRLERAQIAMRRENLDALLVTTEAELRYFTGFRTLFWQSPTRPWFLVVPKNGKPIAIIPEIGAALMRETWIDDIRTWASPHATDDGISLLVSVLRDGTRIGILKGRGHALRMPLADYERMREALRSSSFCDASPLVTSLTMVKSAAEIALISRICGVASRCFAVAGKLFFEGQPLDAAFRAFKIELLEQGAEDVPYLVGAADRGGYADVISPPGRQPLKDGDVLMLDTGATLKGYFCDFDRNFAIAHASDAANSAYETLYRATEAGLRAARPGVRCSDLHAIMLDVIAQDGGDVGRFGHGLGAQLTEEPSIVSFDHTVLEAGMVLTLEPSMLVSEGKIMVHEENIVIREGAAELLTTRTAPELPVI